MLCSRYGNTHCRAAVWSNLGAPVTAMLVVGKEKVVAFLKRHHECAQEVNALLLDLESTELPTAEAVRGRYPSAKVLDGRTIVFKVRGNKFRLSVRIAYNTGIMVIIALETHAEYDRRQLR